ncbi:hypothetical protein LNKW23_46780 [Paralimibaculum aggregatum]|uniref:VPLPA-CTERM protein sorting domain-containing protein n=1 Tax=Paralimibaculum aggregatum TaxID=3036245 RepID=A0ABQ6LTN4_9RHOB|nr:VPLPA-CTERM sorting domain-containing protein [Limibaculum sp. NKW23]GMG85458.1 hypothetical protein LNKW23_46780 [Limibaculum sp. NKW23]
MRGLFPTLALALALAPGLAVQPAAAAVRTLEIQIANLAETGAFYEAIGGTGPAPSTATARVSFDTGAAAYSELQHDSTLYRFDGAFRPYLGFEVTIGDVVLATAPSLNANESLYVADGIADRSSDFIDLFRVGSQTPVDLGGGATLGLIELTAYDYDHTIFSGTEPPDLAALLALDDYGYFQIRVGTPSGEVRLETPDTADRGNLSFSEITSEVPLPAGLPLLLAGLGGLGWIAGRRRGAA